MTDTDWLRLTVFLPDQYDPLKFGVQRAMPSRDMPVEDRWLCMGVLVRKMESVMCDMLLGVRPTKAEEWTWRVDVGDVDAMNPSWYG